jgi:hypothetical protein
MGRSGAGLPANQNAGSEDITTFLFAAKAVSALSLQRMNLLGDEYIPYL